MDKSNRNNSVKRKANILLLFPPMFRPYQPYLSLPALSAFLKQEGHQAVQRDLNLGAFEYLLTKRQLRLAHLNIKEKFKKLSSRARLKKEEKKYYSILTRVLFDAEEIIENIEAAKKEIRDKRSFYHPDKYQRSKDIISAALRLISVVYYPTRLSLDAYMTDYNRYSSSDVIKASSDEEKNIFLDYFREQCLHPILKQDFDLIGISLVGDYQIIPAFTLAGLIKKYRPRTHLTIGGSLITFLKDEIITKRELLKFVDSLIINEGETALSRLALELVNGKRLDKVPNLIYKDKGQIRCSDSFAREDINRLPTPCYDGLPLDSYFSAEPVLSIQLSRGCYWRRCTFCNNHKMFDHYKIRDTGLLINDIKQLSKRYNTRYFAFITEAIMPKQLNKVADAIKRNNLNIRWYIGMRFEKGFTRNFSILIKRAGCRKILFGLESTSQRILNLMQKGIDIKRIKNILTHCSKQKISVHLYCLVGFPGETIKDLNKTFNFILNNKRLLNFMGFSFTISTFQLKRHSLISKYPYRFGVKITKDRASDISFDYRYITKTGISQEEALRQSFFIKDALSRNFTTRILNFPVAHALLYISKSA